jgi:molybdopterin synthase sulfur carrier subunit
MAVTVKLPTILRKHTDGVAAVDAEGGTVGEVLRDLESRHPGVTRMILTDDGAGLHRFVNVYVNGEDVRYGGSLGVPVSEGDTISILPAVAGG